MVSRVMAPPVKAPAVVSSHKLQASLEANVNAASDTMVTSKKLVAVPQHRPTPDPAEPDPYHCRQILPISPVDEGSVPRHQIALLAHTPTSTVHPANTVSDQRLLHRQLSDPPSNRSLILDTPESLLQDPNSTSRETCTVSNPNPSPAQAQAPHLDPVQSVSVNALELSFQGFNPGSEKLAPALDALIRADSMLTLTGAGAGQQQPVLPALEAERDCSGRVSPCMTDANVSGHTVPDTPDDPFQSARFPWMASAGCDVAQAGTAGASPAPPVGHLPMPCHPGTLQPLFHAPDPPVHLSSEAAGLATFQHWPAEEARAQAKPVDPGSSEPLIEASVDASPSAPKRRRRNRFHHDVDPAFDVSRPGSATLAKSPSTDGSAGCAHPWQSLGAGTPSVAGDAGAPPAAEVHTAPGDPHHDDSTPVFATCAPSAALPGSHGLGSTGSDGQRGNPSVLGSHVSTCSTRERQVSTWLSEKIAGVLKSKCVHTACVIL